MWDLNFQTQDQTHALCIESMESLATGPPGKSQPVERHRGVLGLDEMSSAIWTVVLEKTPESPLDCKEIKPVNPKGNQHWIFIGRTNAEAEAPILWLPEAKSQLLGKDPDVDGHEFEQTLGDGEGQGSLVCCSPWGRKESDTAERLNNKADLEEDREYGWFPQPPERSTHRTKRTGY